MLASRQEINRTELSQTDIFITADGAVELCVPHDEETVWLTQAQMGELFGTTSENITQHLKNIYLSEELEENRTTKNFLAVRQEGNRQVRRHLKHYNLDAIISVGYRVSSKRATQFRQWATRTLKQHLIDGYTVNQQRLNARGIEYQQLLDLLSRTLTQQSLINEQGSAVMSVVQDYARSWFLLQSYDEQSLREKSTQQNNMRALSLAEAEQGIAELKKTLIAKGEATQLFGQPRGDGLASALETIEQGFGETLFYPNIASRAAHLLYFIIKNHPFTDGNKRGGAFLFLYYLTLNQEYLAKPVEKLINDHTLVALALLIAESEPAQKMLMIRLIEHFILLKEETL